MLKDQEQTLSMIYIFLIITLYNCIKLIFEIRCIVSFNNIVLSDWEKFFWVIFRKCIGMFNCILLYVRIINVSLFDLYAISTLTKSCYVPTPRCLVPPNPKLSTLPCK